MQVHFLALLKLDFCYMFYKTLTERNRKVFPNFGRFRHAINKLRQEHSRFLSYRLIYFNLGSTWKIINNGYNIINTTTDEMGIRDTCERFITIVSEL